MISEAHLNSIRSVISNGNRFALTTHANPDGDAIGSEIGLAQYLNQLGKEVHIFNHNQTPASFEFLDPFEEIQVFDYNQHAELVKRCDAIFILDISHWKRLRSFGEYVRDLDVFKVCIDHHPGELPFVDIDVVNAGASSTGELIYLMLKKFEARIQGRMAEALYTAVMTDTGSFRFSNTIPFSHEVAGELLEAGVRPHIIYQQVYENQPVARMRLMARMLDKLQFDEEFGLAWFTITQDDLRTSGTSPKDTEGFVDIPRTIRGVEVSMMFLETADGKIKVSLRSKGNKVINGLANRYGGGGHPFAAGALVDDGDVKDVVDRVVADARMLF